MKKTVLTVTAVLLSVFTVLVSVSPAGALKLKRYYGDIDYDGLVSTADARAALIFALEIAGGELYGADADCADVDRCGKVTVADALIILRMAIGTVEKKYMENYEFTPHAEEFVKEVNKLRSKSLYPELDSFTYSDTLSKAADEAAREFVEDTGTALYKLDGGYYYKLLDEYKVRYTMADKIIIQAGSGYMDALNKMKAETQSNKALMNKNYTKMGVGAFTDDGKTFYWCVLLVK